MRILILCLITLLTSKIFGQEINSNTSFESIITNKSILLLGYDEIPQNEVNTITFNKIDKILTIKSNDSFLGYNHFLSFQVELINGNIVERYFINQDFNFVVLVYRIENNSEKLVEIGLDLTNEGISKRLL
jgi:hypothetical protein